MDGTYRNSLSDEYRPFGVYCWLWNDPDIPSDEDAALQDAAGLSRMDV